MDVPNLAVLLSVAGGDPASGRIPVIRAPEKKLMGF
jgi:hypothetical protein